MRKLSSMVLAVSGVAAAASVGYAQTAPAPAAPARAEFQWPARMKNAKVLPATMGADALRDTMRNFSLSLGVRCGYCHVQGDFASDANPHKNIARGMIRMSMRINAELPKIADKGARISCYSCHRGATKPAVLPPPPPVLMPVAPPAPKPAG